MKVCDFELPVKCKWKSRENAYTSEFLQGSVLKLCFNGRKKKKKTGTKFSSSVAKICF